MTRVLVCGAREWDDVDYIFERLDDMVRYYGIDFVIDGCARGADRAAGWPCPSVKLQKQQPEPRIGWAESRGVPHDHYPAKWNEYGNAAGAIRNRRMLKEGKPDLVVAFHTQLQV